MANKSDFKKLTRLLNESAVELIGEELAFNVYYWGAMPEHYDNPLHRHSYFEVCYVTEGEGYYYESDREYPLLQGTMFFSRPGMWHQIKSRTGLALLYVAYEIDEARSKREAVDRYLQLLHNNRIVVAQAEDSITAQTWRTLLALCKQDHYMVKEAVRCFACALLISFYSEFSESTEYEDLPDKQQVPAYLQRAKLFIEDNLTLSLNLQQLSGYLHITERHLSRLFAEKVGQTFSHYVQERRVQKAIELLLETDWTISRIAVETGFESIHYFTRVFTSKVGVPPGKFRRSQLSETPFINR
ncbi:AraC family transcriptional regulator [Paenibacillus lignilyticus]|uniref:Helix-turn-helix transcriptional regulator n=1 Tax=Paenibacillus lignilyticus TaxID=1172615 RepID=A0ABS5CAP5_9BACL|nr:AraC family transcriptional regulator [Paenibacillus lignilyticus]MBP3962525.1 helix-turn-helix transcriptional regulator [Paenibacillus lignilyticus]